MIISLRRPGNITSSRTFSLHVLKSICQFSLIGLCVIRVINYKYRNFWIQFLLVSLINCFRFSLIYNCNSNSTALLNHKIVEDLPAWAIFMVNRLAKKDVLSLSVRCSDLVDLINHAYFKVLVFLIWWTNNL